MEWISVEDKLPDEEDEYYLIYIDNHIVRVGMYCYGGWNCCTGIFMTDSLRPCHSVTHWMPLPEAPEK